MTEPTTPPEVSLLLSPVEAELIRYADAEFKRVTAEANARRREAVQLVLDAKAIPEGAKFAIRGTPEGLSLVYTPPEGAPPTSGEAGQVDRKLELVPGGASSEGNGAASEAGGAEAP